MALQRKRRSETDPRCTKHRTGPLPRNGVTMGLVSAADAQAATEQAARDARARLQERYGDTPRPVSPLRASNGCPTCIAQEALAWLHGDSEPYVIPDRAPYVPRTATVPLPTNAVTATPADLPAPKPRRRRVGVIAHTIRYR